jgi:carboxymethylenebutenolidase
MGDLNDMQQYLVDEFVEDYQKGQMSRRDAIRRIAGIVGSMAIANSILAACGASGAPASGGATSPPAAAGTQPAGTGRPAGGPQPTPRPPDPAVSVPADDPSIKAEMVQFPGQGATLMGYLARPAAEGTFPIVLVCHENRGLTDHIQDVTRRLAKAGYVGLAVDLLSRQGGTAKVADPAQVPGMLGSIPPEQLIQDFQSGLTYAQSLPYAVKDRAGMVGFCYGGGVTWRVITKVPELRAAVPFYGPNPPLEDVPAINAAVLGIYGEQDTRISSGIPQIEAAMKQNSKTFEKMVYPGANHAFYNDTGANYKPDAAKDAWAKATAWFDKYLKS